MSDRWDGLRAALDALPIADTTWRTWKVEDDDPDWNVRTSDDCPVCDDCADDEVPYIATYIATAHPVTVAALLAERDALASALREIRSEAERNACCQHADDAGNCDLDGFFTFIAARAALAGAGEPS